MLRPFRSPLAAFLLLAATSSIRSTTAAELSPDAATRIVNASHRLGETLIDQRHTAAEIRKILTFYVKGEVASELHPDAPEAALSADEAKQVEPLVDKVMASLPAIAPVDPTPAPVTPPGPAQPVGPEPAPEPKPGTQPVPVFVWVVHPAPQPAPAPVPVFMPAGAGFGYPGGFAPPPMLPGGAPTIHIKHGWFGHPDKVWYSRH